VVFLQGRSAYASGSMRVDASSVGRLLSGASSALRGGVARIVANPAGSGWSRSPHGRRDDGPGRDPQGFEDFNVRAQGPAGSASHGGVARIVANPKGSGWSCSPHGRRVSGPDKPSRAVEEKEGFVDLTSCWRARRCTAGWLLLSRTRTGSGWSCSPHGRRDVVWERVAMDSSALYGGVARIVANPKGSGWSCSPHGRRDVKW
jgi:hypothetical protein